MADLALFETRTMLAALEQMLPVRTFLKDTFFPTENTFITKHVDIDIRKGKRRLAPYVKPVSQGKLVDRIGFKTNSYEPPYIKPKMVTTAQDFLTRNIGETIYGATDGPQERAEKQVGKDLAELDEMITRREETQAAELLQSGKVTVSGEGYDTVVIDYGMPATHLPVLTGTDLWTDTTNSTPLEDLRTWKRLISKDSGLVPTDVVMAADVLDAFLAHPKVQNQLDTRRIDLGLILPEQLADGVTFYGRIRDIGCDLWTYEECYIDPAAAPTEKPMINDNYLIMSTRRARTSVNYGAIQDLKAGNAAVPRFPKSWEEEDPSVRYLMVQSAPLLALHQVDAFLCAKVV